MLLYAMILVETCSHGAFVLGSTLRTINTAVRVFNLFLYSIPTSICVGLDV